MVIYFSRLREFGNAPRDPGRHTGASNRLMLHVQSHHLLPMRTWREGDDHVIHFESARAEPDSIDFVIGKKGLTVETAAKPQSPDEFSPIVWSRP
jgi:hypothetical protein